MTDFSHPYFTSGLITCIGNKRALLPFIAEGVEFVKRALGRDKLSVFEGFAGSGAVSGYLKTEASRLTVCDLEEYSRVVNSCRLASPSAEVMERTRERIEIINNLPPRPGFIAANYAPENDDCIKPGERVFYTRRNGVFIDTAKEYIFTEIPQAERDYCLAPLIEKASVHTNTSGVFKGFHKQNGVGKFGGRGGNALGRIMKDIVLEMPLFYPADCDVEVLRGDAESAARERKGFDMAYLDPPYNRHPYGSNYFMLNIIASPDMEPDIQDGVSGILKDWNRSPYNSPGMAAEALRGLIDAVDAKYILLSYNNEGLIPQEELKSLLSEYGETELRIKDYNTYRGSRNLRKRNIKVKEQLWILKKGHTK